MTRALRILLRGLAITALAYPAVALVLIASQPPRKSVEGQDIDFSALTARGAAEPLPVVETPARDGATLRAFHLPAPDADAPLLVMLHGSGWYGAQFHGLARALSDRAELLVPNLRGHFMGPEPRGDVAHIGQLEEDVADLIDAHRDDDQTVILAGHSSGGGLAIRFAGGPHGAMIDAAVLLAPFLHHDAPTMRDNAGGWARPLTRRIVGLTMLNAVGIGALNHLTAIQFAMPPEVLDGPEGKKATTAYSYALTRSYAPRDDYLADIAALPPFLLIAGTEDRAFRAKRYEPTMSAATDAGRYHLIDGAGHLDLVGAPETAERMAGFLDDRR